MSTHCREEQGRIGFETVVVDDCPAHCCRLAGAQPGAGPPILLVHGLACSWEMWEPFLHALLKQDTRS
jgi:pimeloyl-ACP methyl ester carboxylesterase